MSLQEVSRTVCHPGGCVLRLRKYYRSLANTASSTYGNVPNFAGVVFFSRQAFGIHHCCLDSCDLFMGVTLSAHTLIQYYKCKAEQSQTRKVQPARSELLERVCHVKTWEVFEAPEFRTSDVAAHTLTENSERDKREPIDHGAAATQDRKGLSSASARPIVIHNMIDGALVIGRDRVGNTVRGSRVEE